MWQSIEPAKDALALGGLGIYSRTLGGSTVFIKVPVRATLTSWWVDVYHSDGVNELRHPPGQTYRHIDYKFYHCNKSIVIRLHLLKVLRGITFKAGVGCRKHARESPRTRILRRWNTE